MRSFIPTFCALSEDCLRVSCSVNILDVDTIGFGLKLHHCTDPINAVVYANESDIGLSWSHVFTARASVAIPGLSISIPIVGGAAVFAIAEIGGDESDAFIAVGLEACLVIGEDGVPVNASRTNNLRAASPHSRPADPITLETYGLSAPAVVDVPGVGKVDLAECYPTPPITIIKQSIDFTGVPCDDDGGAVPNDDKTINNDVPFWANNDNPSPPTNDNTSW
jgi:hypothetical protein